MAGDQRVRRIDIVFVHPAPGKALLLCGIEQRIIPDLPEIALESGVITQRNCE